MGLYPGGAAVICKRENRAGDTGAKAATFTNKLTVAMARIIFLMNKLTMMENIAKIRVEMVVQQLIKTTSQNSGFGPTCRDKSTVLHEPRLARTRGGPCTGNALLRPKNVPSPKNVPHNSGMISQKLRGHLFGFPPLVVNFTTNKINHDDRITYITYYFFH